jgi:hypothetical protein
MSPGSPVFPAQNIFGLDSICPTCRFSLWGEKTERHHMIDRQMELRIAKSTRSQSPVRRGRPAPRARWWFARMRQVVDNAIDWPPAMPSDPARQGE